MYRNGFIKVNTAEVINGSNSNTEGCGGLIRMAPIGSHILMLSYQSVEVFERIRKVRRRGPAGGSVSLRVGLEVSGFLGADYG